MQERWYGRCHDSANYGPCGIRSMFRAGFFPLSCRRRHMSPTLLGPVLSGFLSLLAIVFSGRAEADPRPVDGTFTFACAYLGDCPLRTVPGAPDRWHHAFPEVELLLCAVTSSIDDYLGLVTSLVEYGKLRRGRWRCAFDSPEADSAVNE